MGLESSQGELAIDWQREMKQLVIKLVVMFLKSGHLTVAQFKGHPIKAYVRAENGHGAYLAVVAEGVPDPRIIALILELHSALQRKIGSRNLC